MDSIGFEQNVFLAQQASAYPSDLVQLKKDASGNVQVSEVAKRFEQIFIQQLLSQLNNSLETGLFGSGLGSGIYQGLFETYLAQEIADSGGIGIAPVVEKSLQSSTTEKQNET